MFWVLGSRFEARGSMEGGRLCPPNMRLGRVECPQKEIVYSVNVSDVIAFGR